MRIKLILIGKTNQKYLVQGIAEYTKRLTRYCKLEIVVIPDIKNAKSLSESEQKKKEGALILKQIPAGSHVVLLDENGEMYDSVKFSKSLQRKMNQSVRSLVFVVGGPYGFSEDVYKIATEKMSLSKMTFSHQMIRLFFVEQLYRGFTILRNEPYHHR